MSSSYEGSYENVPSAYNCVSSRNRSCILPVVKMKKWDLDIQLGGEVSLSGTTAPLNVVHSAQPEKTLILLTKNNSEL